MMGTSWVSEHRLKIRVQKQRDADRLIEIKRILGQAECTVKYICIDCKRNEQLNREQKKCRRCLNAIYSGT